MCGVPPRELLGDCPENRVDGKFGHTPMMPKRTRSLLAGSAIDLMLQMQSFRVVRFAPGDVRRPEERDDWNIKRSREVARA